MKNKRKGHKAWNKGIHWFKSVHIRSTISCPICQKRFYAFPCEIKRGRKKYCSRKCYEISKRTINIKAYGGYVWIRFPEHPFCNSGGYVPEHRLVMEKHIKRYLTPAEIVHHINENRSDNKIENLKLFANRAEHTRFHRKAKNH